MRRLSTLSFLALLSLSACGTASAPSPLPDQPPASASSSSASLSSSPSPTMQSNWTWDGKTLVTGKHVVRFTTSMGEIELELDADAAPKTVTNFMALIATGYYNNLTFHRVIPGFMIQGGDPSGNGTGGKSVFGETFADEINPDSLLYKAGYTAGTIAMANRGPDTNGSQFFIMDQDYPLPPNYTIFGHVTRGQSVVNAIANVKRDGRDMPLTKVTFVPMIVR